jgi:hypothetical protein
MGRFCHISLLIDLDQEWWLPTAAALREPHAYFPRRSRVYLHETIHFWHQLCHGYLLALAEEDWGLLRSWEQGAAPAPGPLREAFVRPTGRNGFSPSDLCESLARFWEITAVGHEAVLNEAMDAERARSLEDAIPDELLRVAGHPMSAEGLDEAIASSGSYSLPYRVARRTLSPAYGQVLFPLIGHFALQTPDPVVSFERFAEQVSPLAATHLDAHDAQGSAWLQPDLVCALYKLVRDACGDLFDAETMFERSALGDNPAYRACFGTLAALDRTEFDMAVAMPAGPQHREFLIRHASPPCVRFRDRMLPVRAMTSDAPATQSGAEDLASACAAVQERWESFQRAGAI